MGFDHGKLQDFAPGEGVAADAQTSGYDDSAWLDTGRAGRCPPDADRGRADPDPFYDRNETACAWMEEREWWYRLRFDGTDGAARRRTSGCSSSSTVWIPSPRSG